MTLGGSRSVRSRVGLPVGALETRADGTDEPATYYDIPFLKEPTWDWKVATYFFLESVSSGATLISSLAELSGRGRNANIRRIGSFVAVAAFVPCAPLLVWDLGRPARFHHMLRIFKATSPMSHGSWTLMIYGFPLAARAIGMLTGKPEFVAERPLAVAAIPCSLMLATYPGVLLSTTANPLWSRTRLLGALFASTAVHGGASALALALRGAHTDERARVERIETIAAAAEATLLAAVLVASGRHARPLVSGRVGRLFLFGAIGSGIVLPMLLKALVPSTGRTGRFVRAAASALSLVGSLALKLAFVYGGHAAARDARASHRAAR